MSKKLETTQSDAEKAEAKKPKPVTEVRVGSVCAAIWANRTETGVMYNTTLKRIYKDGEDWKSTSSFGRDDLLLMGKVADLAYDRVQQLIARDATLSS